MGITPTHCLHWESEIQQLTLGDSTCTRSLSWAQRLLHRPCLYADAGSARDVFRALTLAWSAVLGPELSRHVRLVLAKAVSEVLAPGRGRQHRAQQCQPGAVQCPTGDRRGAARAMHHALQQSVWSCPWDSPPPPPPGLPLSLCSVLFSPPSCCEAPHSFPHSHFHFPALGFASTLFSASFAQMTSNKTIRDAPIRL